MIAEACRTKTGPHRLSGTFYSRISCRDEFRLLHRETKRGWTERLETLLRCLCRCRRNRVSAACKGGSETGAYISLGFSERDAVNGTLYNSNVIFEPDGSYKVHRKLKPTGSERVVWGMLTRDTSLLQRRVGADRQPDLLGKLYAACPCGSLSKRHHHLHLPQYQ